MTYEGTLNALKDEVDRLRVDLASLQETYGARNSVTIGDYILMRLAQLGVTVMLIYSSVPRLKKSILEAECLF